MTTSAISWLPTLFGAALLLLIAFRARRLARSGRRGLLSPAWLLVFCLGAIPVLFLACADDVYAIYLRLRGFTAAEEWDVRAPPSVYATFTIAMSVLAAGAALTMILAHARHGAACKRCLHPLLPEQETCPECGTTALQGTPCSRLDALSVRWPILGLMLESIAILPPLGLLVGLSLAFIPVPRIHQYSSMLTPKMHGLGYSGAEQAHVLYELSVARSWAPWLPWPGLQFDRRLAVRWIVPLNELAAFVTGSWSDMDDPPYDPADFVDRVLVLRDAADLTEFVAALAGSTMPVDGQADCAAYAKLLLEHCFSVPAEETERAIAAVPSTDALRQRIALHAKPPSDWNLAHESSNTPAARDPAERTILLPMLIGLAGAVVLFWPRRA